MTTDQTTALYDAIDAFQRTHRLPGLQHAQIRGLLAEHLARVLPAAVPVPPPVDRAAKAEALLLHFTAEAHRRKWSYDRGLDDDGVPIKSEAFDALHRLGEEMRTALEELRRTPAVSSSAVVSADRATLRDRIADTVTPFLANFSDEEAARINAAEVADALLSVLPAPAPVCICGHSKQQHFEDACITEITGCNCGDYLEPQDAAEVIDRWRQAALHARATNRATLLREAADDEEGDELACVDECGSCDACGMEPFGTPAEGWREAARFLRRTARDSTDRQGALHGARLIEAELRRVAAEEQPAETQAEEPETEEQRVRAHVTTLHLIGEQLAGIESWMWEHLADVRDAEERPVVGEQPDTQTREA